MTQRIALSGKLGAGRFALVDDADVPLVSQYRWHLRKSGQGARLLLYAAAYIPGPARVAQADQVCSVCQQRPAMARRACYPCYKRYWRAGRLDELAPAKPILGGGRSVRMHNLIMGRPGIDHANGDGLDNTRRNLRIATQQQQAWNRRATQGSTSRYKGVSRHTPGRWKAEITVHGQRHYLGLFATEEAAAHAYDTEALAAHGSYARLNFPHG